MPIVDWAVQQLHLPAVAERGFAWRKIEIAI